MNSFPRQVLSGKDKKQLITKLTPSIANIAELLPKKAQIARLVISKKESVLVKGKQILLLDLNGIVFPHLKFIRKLEHKFPIIKVDTGAIRFVTNGADIMRPGVTEIDDNVSEGELVLIVEETRGGPLCIGISQYDAVDMRAMTKGKCIKNLHYLKDKYFEFEA